MFLLSQSTQTYYRPTRNEPVDIDAELNAEHVDESPKDIQFCPHVPTKKAAKAAANVDLRMSRDYGLEFVFLNDRSCLFAIGILFSSVASSRWLIGRLSGDTFVSL